jgi:prepilin-type N-terminal cleavage/methylation domain-containing protein
MNIIKTNRRALQSGTTLIELSVVIAVLLLLASVLFLGVQGWRDAANRSAAIVAISSIQKAVRGYQNINLANVADACDSATNIAPFFGGNLPTDASNANNPFTYGAAIPAYGTLYATSGNATTKAQAAAMATTGNW